MSFGITTWYCHWYKWHNYQFKGPCSVNLCCEKSLAYTMYVEVWKHSVHPSGRFLGRRCVSLLISDCTGVFRTLWLSVCFKIYVYIYYTYHNCSYRYLLDLMAQSDGREILNIKHFKCLKIWTPKHGKYLRLILFRLWE